MSSTPAVKQPLVSIVTPSYNQAPFLEQTIRSVLEQDYPYIEYIVIDGGSTDGSVEIVKSYADRLAYWVSEKDSGQAEAINKGFTHASGEIFAWLNSDDFYLPGTVSAAVRCLQENPDVVLVYGDMLAVDATGQTINVLKYRQLTLQDFLCLQIIGQPSVFFRRSAFEKAGPLDTSFHFMLDHHLWIRLVQQGRILHVPQIWSAARYHPAAKNRARAAEFGGEGFRVLDWARSQPGLKQAISGVEQRARASAHRYEARYLLDGGQPAAALAAWFRALSLHPPTALARLNILVSSILNLMGLSRVREAILERRRKQFSGKKQGR